MTTEDQDNVTAKPEVKEEIQEIEKVDDTVSDDDDEQKLDDDANDDEEIKPPKNNIKFIGGKNKEAPAEVRVNNKLSKLPDTETQKKGFYLESARDVINTFPHLYKKLKSKGDK